MCVGGVVVAFSAIKREIKKFPESKKQIAESVLKKAIFQHEQLQILQKIIQENGWVEEYQNGENQKGRKKTAEADSYLSLAKVYVSTIKQLAEIMEIEDADKGDNALFDFLKAKKVK